MPESEFNRVFSRNLRYYLDQYQMTQLELSKKLGVGTTSVSNWCNGIKTPRMDKLDAMCRIFHCTRSELMEEKTNAPENIFNYRLTDGEILHIEKYRSIDAAGKNMVDTILDREYERANDRIFLLNAAHSRTDIELPKDIDTSDDDIMDDENF